MLLKKSDLEQGITYLVCPDNSCQLFYDSPNGSTCDLRCPRVNDLVKIILCKLCDSPIELSGYSGLAARVGDDHTCPDGRSIRQFRMVNGYKLIYVKPE